jgi:hypothetical protein
MPEPNLAWEDDRMTSPFPGMDPYLEHPGYWRDFHERFITYWCDWLADHLPDHYDVRIDEWLGVVAEQNGGGKTMEETESFLRIMHRPDNSLIAVLELLSPTNKEGDGRQLYLEKHNELLRETVHLVELDLLLGGKRLPIRGEFPTKAELPYAPGDYFAYVSRGDRRPMLEVYGWKLSEPLTRIRLPLKPPDPDLIFDLPGLLAEAYRKGRYARDLPYTSAPPVALSQENAKWVAERLREWKQREEE